jgi:hypothetical protein
MRYLLYSFTFCIFFEGISQNQIIIDGFFEDWQSNPTVETYIDSSVDSPGTDLLSFSVTNDEDHLFIKIKLDTEVDLIDENDLADIKLYLDTDNNPSTGYPSTDIFGSEYGIEFQARRIFDDVNYPDYTIESLYLLNIKPMPTITSDEFEIMIDRQQFFSESISILIKESISNDYMPDENQIYSYTFHDTVSQITDIEIEKENETHIRVCAYNVHHDLLDPNNELELARVISTIGADIYCFSECSEVSESEMLNYFATFINVDEWHAFKHDDLVTVSKFPFIETYDVTSKISAAFIDLPNEEYDSDFLAFCAHPPCCGNDAGRQYHFDAFIGFLLDIQVPGGVGEVPINTPFTFSGDMNLVGLSEQYETILNGTISDVAQFGEGGMPDWDGTPIVDAICRLTERNSAHTWRTRYPGPGDYPPGRLDFNFYSNSVLSISKSFTLCTEEMSLDNLQSYNLQANDTFIGSDHLPVVTDFILTGMSSSEIGCTYSLASNFSSDALVDDGSCLFDCDYSSGYVDGLADGIQQGDGELCLADLNYDDLVSTSDLLILLSQFGVICE